MRLVPNGRLNDIESAISRATRSSRTVKGTDADSDPLRAVTVPSPSLVAVMLPLVEMEANSRGVILHTTGSLGISRPLVDFTLAVTWLVLGTRTVT
jgi:hypothetical protein